MEAPSLYTINNGNKTNYSFQVLFVIFAIVYCFIYPSFDNSKVVIEDKARLLSTSEESKLAKELTVIGNEIGTNFLIVTQDACKPQHIAFEADEALKNINMSQKFFGRWFFPRSGFTILFFYSKQPSLTQIRYGRHIKYKARIAGINRGDIYNHYQNISLDKPVPDFLALSQQIKIKFNKTKQSFIKSSFYKVSTFISDDLIKTLSIPKFIVRKKLAGLGTVHIFNFLGSLFQNYYLFVIFLLFGTALIIFIFSLILWHNSNHVVTSSGQEVWYANSNKGCLVFFVVFSLFIIVIYPLLGYLNILSNNRAEDIIMLHSIGVKNLLLNIPKNIHWIFYVLIPIITIIILTIIIPEYDERTSADELEIAKSSFKFILYMLLLVILLPAYFIIIVSVLILYIIFFKALYKAYINRFIKIKNLNHEN